MSRAKATARSHALRPEPGVDGVRETACGAAFGYLRGGVLWAIHGSYARVFEADEADKATCGNCRRAGSRTASQAHGKDASSASDLNQKVRQ